MKHSLALEKKEIMNKEVKKTWIKPELEVISKDAIKSGSVTYTESAVSPFGGTGFGNS